MEVLFVSSEIVPFASTGGLADVAGALPQALQARGIRMARVMPCYRHVMESGYAIEDTGLRLQVPVGFATLTAEVWAAEEPAPKTYFIRRDEYFDRCELYSLPERDYDDNFERFIFFQKAVVSLIDSLTVQPKIVHPQHALDHLTLALAEPHDQMHRSDPWKSLRSSLDHGKHMIPVRALEPTEHVLTRSIEPKPDAIYSGLDQFLDLSDACGQDGHVQGQQS